jgi:uncharacterized protein YegL
MPGPGPFAPPPQQGAPMGLGMPSVSGWGLPQSEEKEPMLLLDTTGSMNYGTSESDQTPRKETIREAIGIIVSTLGREDSQAAHEAHGGGLRTVTFAGGKALDLDDLNPRNLQQKWKSIRWAGGTRIMPGWRKLWQVYLDEFGSRPPQSRPLLMALIITDGDADDSEQFANTLRQLTDRVYVTLAIIGYGEDHDSAVKTYQKIMEQNAHVKVLTFGSETNPQVIARALLKMVE